MNLDTTALDTLRKPILQVWSAIASDVAQFANTNFAAIEMCIDAERIVEFARDRPAQDTIDALFDNNSYSDVMNFLSQNIRII